MSFKELKFIKPLQKAVEATGYTEPTLVQERSEERRVGKVC